MPSRYPTKRLGNDSDKAYIATVDRNGEQLKLGGVHSLVGGIVGNGGMDGIAERGAVGGDLYAHYGGSKDPRIGDMCKTELHPAEINRFSQLKSGLNIVAREAQLAVGQVVDIALLTVEKCTGGILVVGRIGFVGECAGYDIIECELLSGNK